VQGNMVGPPFRFTREKEEGQIKNASFLKTFDEKLAVSVGHKFFNAL